MGHEDHYDEAEDKHQEAGLLGDARRGLDSSLVELGPQGTVRLGIPVL